ncbi:MAG: TolC family protein [Verrucomicrobiaceae bacterium]|nr:TolC family protein [Verrucomicrobiaceae bacterium]
MRNRFSRLSFLLGVGCALSSCVPSLDEATPHKLGNSAFVPGKAKGLEVSLTEEEKDEEYVRALPTFEDPGGDLGLRELTQMAVANSPQFAEAAGNLRVAKARWNIIGEWRDPEFRGGFDWDDVRVEKASGGPGTDTVRRNEEVNTSVRLYPPNPFQLRAELDKAMAEISFAEFALRQVGKELVVDVRRLYQDLQFIQESIRLGKGLHRLEIEERDRLEQLLESTAIVLEPVVKQRIQAMRKQGIASPSEIRFVKVRSELAALIGLGDPRRIAVSGVPNRPVIGFRDDTVMALSEMAFINNLKLGDLDRLQKLAKGDLRAFKAKRIPWVSFLEGGRNRTYNERLAVNDNWSVRLAIDVPIFSLFSKEGDIYKEQIRSYQKQAELYRKRIQLSVATAIASIRDARDGLGRYDKETQGILADMKRMETELENSPFQADVLHLRKLTSLGRSRERLAAEQAYHDALLNLEEIIRDDIEKVFRNRG